MSSSLVSALAAKQLHLCPSQGCMEVIQLLAILRTSRALSSHNEHLSLGIVRTVCLVERELSHSLNSFSLAGDGVVCGNEELEDEREVVDEEEVDNDGGSVQRDMSKGSAMLRSCGKGR